MRFALGGGTGRRSPVRGRGLGLRRARLRSGVAGEALCGVGQGLVVRQAGQVGGGVGKQPGQEGCGVGESFASAWVRWLSRVSLMPWVRAAVRSSFTAAWSSGARVRRAAAVTLMPWRWCGGAQVTVAGVAGGREVGGVLLAQGLGCGGSQGLPDVVGDEVRVVGAIGVGEDRGGDEGVKWMPGGTAQESGEVGDASPQRAVASSPGGVGHALSRPSPLSEGAASASACGCVARGPAGGESAPAAPVRRGRGFGWIGSCGSGPGGAGAR